MFDDLVKCTWIVNGELGKRFAIEFDVRFLQTVDKHAVSQATLTDGGVDTNDPQLAELSLADASITIGVNLSTNQSFFRCAEQTAATANVTLNLLE